MMELSNMLIIGGASRNVGKTELVCGLIRRLGQENPIISLKISGINPGSDPLHGDHGPPPEKFHLLEETSTKGLKDSSKMLLAGASKAFYLRTRDEYLQEALDYFFSVADKGSVIICESILVRRLIIPGLFIIIRSISEESVKKSLGEVQHLADLTIVSDGRSFCPDPSVICLEGNTWRICK
ncbi:MAG: hypothetical protein ACFCUM_15190 [Bacteroidales bacterium]